MNIIDQIIRWVDTGLTLAVSAGLIPEKVAAIADTIARAYTQMRAGVAAADRSTLDAQAISVFRAKGLAFVLRNDELQREFSGDEPPAPDVPVEPV